MRGFMQDLVKRSAEQADLAREFHASGFPGAWLHESIVGRVGLLRMSAAMKRLLSGMLVGACLLGTAGREACAMTAVGSVLTNLASATFSSLPQPGVAFPYTWTEIDDNDVDTGVLGTSHHVHVLEPPMIGLVKMASPTLVSPGETVEYTICAENLSPTLSAFNIIIRDWLPDNTGYEQIPDPPSNWSWVLTAGSAWSRSHSGTGAEPYTGGEPGAGQTPTYYLKWRLDMLGPSDSACVTFRVTIQ